MRYALTLRLLTLSLLLLAVEARAQWVTDQVNEIMDRVRGINHALSEGGDIVQTARDLRRQLENRRARGEIIADIVPEVLEYMLHRRAPLLDFLNTPSGPSCDEGSGSQCDHFREQLGNFFENVASLTDRLPAVDRLGLKDRAVGRKLLEKVPGFLLFPAYEALTRIPDWELIPHNLAEIVDDIGDPEAFSLDWRADIPLATTAAFSVSVAKPSQRFCERTLPRILDDPYRFDPIFNNRLKVIFLFFKDLTAAIAEFLPQDLTADVLGEGAGNVPNPWVARVKGISQLIDVVGAMVEARRANLDVCRAKLRDYESDLIRAPGASSSERRPEPRSCSSISRRSSAQRPSRISVVCRRRTDNS